MVSALAVRYHCTKVLLSAAALHSGFGGHGALARLLMAQVLQHEHHLGRIEAGDIGRQLLPCSYLVVQLTCSSQARRT